MIRHTYLVGPPGFEPGTVRFPELGAMSLPLSQFFNLKKT